MLNKEPAYQLVKMKGSKTVYVHFGLLALLTLLSLWSWQKWHTVWIERSEGFFPPEFAQIHDLDELAWRYPAYRSNDSYQWVAIAQALSKDDSMRITHNTEEGPLDSGRPNAWHSGLARYLQTGGQLVAKCEGWPAERGINQFAHWAGSPLFLVFLGIGAFMLYRQVGPIASIAFVLLAFFSPAIGWDFHFSRIDHESFFQIAVLIQILTLLACLRQPSLYWGALAGFGSGLGLWIGATPQAIIGVLLLAAVLVEAYRTRSGATATSLLIWGISGFLFALLFGTLDGRWSNNYSLSAWHPLFTFAQLGSGLLAYFAIKRNLVACLIAVLLGASPLVLMVTQGTEAHIWFNPFMRRIHSFIVEFQSPLSNGAWRQWPSLGTALCFTLSCLFLIRTKIEGRLFLIIFASALFVLSLLQTRWLGLTTSVSAIGICLSLQNINSWRSYTAGAFTTTLAIFWITSWVRIEEKPGKLFVADLFLQTGSRDICLNLDYQLVRNQQINAAVAMPFSFAPTAALFDNVHPLGSFYWENIDGLIVSSDLYAANDDMSALKLCQMNGIRYLVVQRMQLGGPFATLVHSVTETTISVEQTLAWRLAHGINLPDWCIEVPFYGTFDPSRFSARIYEIRQP